MICRQKGPMSLYWDALSIALNSSSVTLIVIAFVRRDFAALVRILGYFRSNRERRLSRPGRIENLKTLVEVNLISSVIVHCVSSTMRTPIGMGSVMKFIYSSLMHSVSIRSITPNARSITLIFR